MSGTFDDPRRDEGVEELTPQQERVRALLRDAAEVGPIPADVSARIDAALADAQPQTPVTALASRRRGRLPRLVAAAAGLLVLGGAALVTLDRTGSTPLAGGTANSEAVPATAQVLLSGRDYSDAASVQDLAEDTLDEGQGATAPDATPRTGSTGRGPNLLNAPADEGAGQPSGDATTDPAQRPAAERALACTKQLGVDPDSVLAVEIASWRKVPAALVVHRTDTGAEVVVVALDCRPGDAAYSRVDVPLPTSS